MSSSPTPLPLRPLVAAADGVWDFVLSLTWFIVFVTLMSVGLGLALIAVGIPLLVIAVIGTVWFLSWERERAAHAYGLNLPAPPRVRTPKSGWLRPLAQAWLDVRDPYFWRGVVHELATLVLGTLTVSVLSFLVGGGIAQVLSPLLPASSSTSTWVAGLPRRPAFLAVPLGAVFLALALGLLIGVYHAHRALSQGLLGVTDADIMRRQLAQTATQRDGAVRIVETDRRRIERDLHDGVQPQLVNVGMMLSMAQSKLDTDPAAARELLAEAHAGTQSAIQDLRRLGRGIHPAILTESGLDAALSALVAQVPIPTTLDSKAPGRCGPAAESAAYFFVAEALANAAKHSGASACVVRLRRQDADGAPTLVVDVADNGRGGAAIVPQGGLAGLRDRLAAVGGGLSLRSDAHGTTVTAVLPCV